MRYLIILLMCLSLQVQAHYDDPKPEPNPSPTPVQSPVYPSSHDDTGKSFLLTVIVVGVSFWVYCHFTDKCKTKETPVIRSDDDLKVTPSNMTDKKRQFVIEAQ